MTLMGEVMMVVCLCGTFTGLIPLLAYCCLQTLTPEVGAGMSEYPRISTTGVTNSLVTTREESLV